MNENAKNIRQLSEDEQAGMKIGIQRMLQRGSNQKDIADALDITYATVLKIEPRGNMNNKR